MRERENSPKVSGGSGSFQTFQFYSIPHQSHSPFFWCNLEQLTFNGRQTVIEKLQLICDIFPPTTFDITHKSSPSKQFYACITSEWMRQAQNFFLCLFLCHHKSPWCWSTLTCLICMLRNYFVAIQMQPTEIEGTTSLIVKRCSSKSKKKNNQDYDWWQKT